MNTDLDPRVRLAAFSFLEAETRRAGTDVLPRALLAQGFQFDGRRVPILGPQGIFKPAVLPEMPLSITTVPVEEGTARQRGPSTREAAPSAADLLSRSRPRALRCRLAGVRRGRLDAGVELHGVRRRPATSIARQHGHRRSWHGWAPTLCDAVGPATAAPGGVPPARPRGIPRALRSVPSAA